jgi:hypothetical protein
MPPPASHHNAGVLPPAAFHRGTGQDSAVVFDQADFLNPGALSEPSEATKEGACCLKVQCSVYAVNNIEDTEDGDLCNNILADVRRYRSETSHHSCT